MHPGQTFRCRTLKVHTSNPTFRGTFDFQAPSGEVFVSVLLGVEPASAPDDDPRLIDPRARLREFGWQECLPQGEPGWYWALYDNDEEGIENEVGVIRCIHGDWGTEDPKGSVVPADENITVKILGPRVFEWSPEEKKTVTPEAETPPATLPRDVLPAAKAAKKKSSKKAAKKTPAKKSRKR